MMSKNKKAKKPLSTKNKIRRIAEDIIMVCLVVIMAFSGYKIYDIMHNYKTNQNAYEKISGESRNGEFTGDIDFDSLRAINPDIIGWLYYEGTLIDYPVVQGSDNDKYLNTMFDGTYSIFGSLFADAVTENPFRQFNTIVYGHHMKNGSMFGSLKNLKDSDYCREHPKLELITPEGKFHLEIWAFLNQPADSGVYTFNIKDMHERQVYLDSIDAHASYVTDVEVGPTDRVVVLSTCAYEYDDARYMVICKMVPWEGQNIDMSFDTDTVSD